VLATPRAAGGGASGVLAVDVYNDGVLLALARTELFACSFGVSRVMRELVEETWIERMLIRTQEDQWMICPHNMPGLPRMVDTTTLESGLRVQYTLTTASADAVALKHVAARDQKARQVASREAADAAASEYFTTRHSEIHADLESTHLPPMKIRRIQRAVDMCSSPFKVNGHVIFEVVNARNVVIREAVLDAIRFPLEQSLANAKEKKKKNFKTPNTKFGLYCGGVTECLGNLEATEKADARKGADAKQELRSKVPGLLRDLAKHRGGAETFGIRGLHMLVRWFRLQRNDPLPPDVKPTNACRSRIVGLWVIDAPPDLEAAAKLLEDAAAPRAAGDDDNSDDEDDAIAADDGDEHPEDLYGDDEDAGVAGGEACSDDEDALGDADADAGGDAEDRDDEGDDSFAVRALGAALTEDAG
jgi:hypothetical protein